MADNRFLEEWGFIPPLCAYCGEVYLKQEGKNVLICPNCGAGYQWRVNEEKWFPFKPRAERWKNVTDLLSGKGEE